MQNQIPPVGAFDAFQNMENWSDEQANYWITNLNQRADAPDQVALRAYILEQTGLKAGESVLEIGCGTGRLLSDLAVVVGASGRAYGLEPEAHFAKEAEQYLADKKLPAKVRVFTGRAETIPLADASINVCVAQTVLIHVPGDILPRVFAEVKRVLKPGGRFISVDQDGDTWIIDHPQRTLTRKITQFNSDYRYADGWTGRYLRRLFKQNGFEAILVKSWTHSDTEKESYLYAMAHRIALSSTEHDVISPEECRDWLKKLDEQAAKGDFFSSICYFFCSGKKPN